MGSRLQYRGPADPASDEQGGRPLRQAFPGTQRLKPLDLAPSALTRDAPRSGPVRRGWRYLRLALHLVQGLLTVLLVFPLTTNAAHRRLRQRWSARMLRILGIEVAPAGAISPGCLVVSNHVSWVDIFVINALAPAAFVSKAEVRAWPLIGWLAARNETVFLRRGSRGHARIINAEIGALLGAGRNVAIFPEGTTTDGSHVLHFHAALLQPAVECAHPIQPLSLSYHAPDGRRSGAPAYDGDISLGQCLASIVAQPRLVARVRVAAPLPTDAGRDRRTLAREAREAIVRMIGDEAVAEGETRAA